MECIPEESASGGEVKLRCGLGAVRAPLFVLYRERIYVCRPIQ